ncbi:hypothetical protein EDD11_002061 [Mortierella claussenii]|nr:hypothetical protein EDD11_002061 [Mortierella claussenii]
MVAAKVSKFQQLDAYAKTLDDFRVKTSTGAFVTLACTFIILILVLGELFDYRSIHVESSLVVDSGKKEKMTIYFNITFPKMPCYILTMDVMDVAGNHQTDILHSIYKVQLSPDGTELKREKTEHMGYGSDAPDTTKDLGPDYCGSCYNAVRPPTNNGCCNTCQDIREAYARSGWSFSNPERMEQCVREGYVQTVQEQADQGCRLLGQVTVNKVAGNFHVAPGRSIQRGKAHVHDIYQYLDHGLDFSHAVEYLSFGERIPDSPNVSLMTTMMARISSGSKKADVIAKSAKQNPLDGQVVMAPENEISSGALYMYQYYLKVVGTRYYYVNNKRPVLTNQYSVTQFNRNLEYKDRAGHIKAALHGLPGVFFNFDISPLLVIQREERKSFVSFLTKVCAIVGGIFTVASLVDGLIWRAERTLRRKMELGKSF